MKLIPKQQKRGADEPLEPWVPFPYQTITSSSAGEWSGTEYGHCYLADPSGLKGYAIAESGTTTNIAQFTNNSPFVPVNCTTDFSVRLSSFTGTSPNYGNAQDFKFSYDGTKLLALWWNLSGTLAHITSWNLDTAWDVSGIDPEAPDSFFKFPDIIMGYTRSYLRDFDVSEDGRQLYIFDKSITVLTDNPSGYRGALFVYELSTPFDLATASELDVYVINHRYDTAMYSIYGVTVFSRGHHVDQICMGLGRMQNFNYPNGLEHKYTADGDQGNATMAGDYTSASIHRHERGWTQRHSGGSNRINLYLYTTT